MSQANDKHPELASRPTLQDLQKYVAETCEFRGYSTDTRYCLLLLCEEVGELAKAIRKTTGGTIDPESRDSHVDEEAADVLWMLAVIANGLGVDLEQAFRNKMEINKSRVWKK